MVTFAKRAFFAWLIWELVSATVGGVIGLSYPFLVHAGIVTDRMNLPAFVQPSHGAELKCQYVIVTGTEKFPVDGRMVGPRWRFPASNQPKRCEVA